MIIRHYPEKIAGGIQGWNWIETDTGAWDGPKMDWEKYHLPNIQKYVKQFRTVVQAGGNQGMYPRLLSRMFQNVYTFEPDPYNFKTLVTNCDYDNIIKFQAALGSKHDFCSMNRLTMQNVGMHKINITSDSIIPVLPLDSVIQRNDIDLIMLDLEGFETEALKGMIHQIEDNRPVIFAERPNTEFTKILTTYLKYKIAGNSSMDVVYIPV